MWGRFCLDGTDMVMTLSNGLDRLGLAQRTAAWPPGGIQVTEEQ